MFNYKTIKIVTSVNNWRAIKLFADFYKKTGTRTGMKVDKQSNILTFKIRTRKIYIEKLEMDLNFLKNACGVLAWIES